MARGLFYRHERPALHRAVDQRERRDGVVQPSQQAVERKLRQEYTGPAHVSPSGQSETEWDEPGGWHPGT